MAYPALLPEVQERVTPSHFYDARARSVYALMLERAREGRLPDDIDLPLAAVRLVPGLDIGWVYQCAEGTTSRAPGYLIEQILREHRIRTATFGALEMVRELQDKHGDHEAVLSRHAEALLTAPTERRDGDPSTVVSEALEAIQSAQDGTGVGYTTGLRGLDSWLGALYPGKLYVIAARPGMGKTALAMGLIAAPQADGDSARWGVVSLEMGRAELATRLLARESWVDLHALAGGRCNDAQLARIPGAAKAVERLEFRIDDRPGMTWDQIAAKARQWSLTWGLQGLVIDYAQLIRKRDPKMSNNDHVAEVSQGAKALSRSLDVPVLLLSQLNRQCEQRTDKRPIAADLRDSGSLEQDADVIVMLYREDVYRGAHEASDNVAEVILRKHRGGPIGTAYLEWTGYCARFDDPKGNR